MGSIWEHNQLLLKVGMVMHYSSRYWFGKNKKKVSASADTTKAGV